MRSTTPKHDRRSSRVATARAREHHAARERAAAEDAYRAHVERYPDASAPEHELLLDAVRVSQLKYEAAANALARACGLGDRLGARGRVALPAARLTPLRAGDRRLERLTARQHRRRVIRYRKAGR